MGFALPHRAQMRSYRHCISQKGLHSPLEEQKTTCFFKTLRAASVEMVMSNAGDTGKISDDFQSLITML